jgi:hypothetical protein
MAKPRAAGNAGRAGRGRLPYNRPGANRREVRDGPTRLVSGSGGAAGGVRFGARAQAILSYEGQEGGLQLFVRPSDADVYVDGDYMGKVRDFQGDKALWLPRGLHAMEVRRDGYITFFRQLEVTLGLLDVMVYTMTPNLESR